MNEKIITMKDIRKAKMCARGAREFFISYNLDYSEFLRNGISASIIEATGDPLALKVVKISREDF